MATRGKTKSWPSFSLADLFGAATIFCFSLPPLAMIVFGVSRDPVEGIIVLLFLSPFLLPSIVTGLILWSAMMESITSRDTLAVRRPRD